MVVNVGFCHTVGEEATHFIMDFNITSRALCCRKMIGRGRQVVEERASRDEGQGEEQLLEGRHHILCTCTHACVQASPSRKESCVNSGKPTLNHLKVI